MATTEERLSTLESRFDTLMETLANQLATMNERINDMRAWLIALTGPAGAQLAALVALAVAISRIGR